MVTLLNQYLFDDAGGSPGLTLLPGFHYNPNQTSPLVGGIAPLGWIYSGSAGEAYVNSDLETAFRYNFFPGTPDVKVLVDVKFTNPAAGDREFRLYARMTDPDTTYFVKLSTVTSQGKLRLYRVTGGVEVALGSSTDVTVTPDTFHELGIICAGNSISKVFEGVTEETVVEADADLIYGNRRVGLATENGEVPLGPQVKDLRIFDAVDNSGLTGEFVLFVNDVGYGTAEMRTSGISLERCTITHFGGNSLQVRVKEQHTSPSWTPNSTVVMKAEIDSVSTVIFRGRFKNAKRIGAPPDELVEYFAQGPRALSKYVDPEHPDTQASTITWNALEGQEGYDADFAAKTIGEIIAWYFDTFKADLQAHGAISPEEATTGYVQADLDAITVVPTRFDIGGDFEEVLMALLSMVQDIGLTVEPESWEWRFVDVNGFSSKDLDYEGLEHIKIDVEDDDSDRYTAVRVKSYREEIKEFKAGTAEGGLVRSWNFGLEKDWTPKMMDRTSIVGMTVDTLLDAGAGDGQPQFSVTLPIGITMFPDEWVGCLLSFPILGISGIVVTNAATTFTIAVAGGFPTGSPPVSPGNGDSCNVEDSRANDSATSQNGFSYVHRRFLIADTTKQDLMKAGCGVMYGSMDNPDNPGETRWTPHQIQYSASPGVIVVGAPIISYSEAGAKQGRCETGGDYDRGDARFEGRYKDVTVRNLRVPTTGFRGTCYSEDVSKWDGGGDPVPGDWGVSRVKILEDNEWVDDTQDAGVRAAATAWLKAHQNKPYTGECTITGLDWDFRVLQQAVNFVSAAAQRGNTGLMATDYIYPFEVTYQIRERRTMLVLGDRGEFALQFQNLLATQATETTMARLRITTKKLEQIQECFEHAEEVKATKRDDSPTCATQIRGAWKPKPGGGKVPGGLKKKVDEIQDKLAWIIWILTIQKEIEEPPEDPPQEGEDGGLPPGSVMSPRGAMTSRGSYSLWVMRPHGTNLDEPQSIESDDGTPKVPKVGRDQGYVVTGRGEPVFALFHHCHHEDEKNDWSGGDEMELSNTPMDNTLFVHMRRGAGGDYESQHEGVDWTRADRVITFVVTPTPNSSAHVHYASQGDKVRRSETIHAEAGFEVSITGTILAEAV